NYSRRLKLDAPLTSNIDKYGLIEKPGGLILEDIYPKRIGTISSVTDAFTFTDAGLDFDINGQLLPGVTAKVLFQSGDLAGWEFEVETYNHSTKTFKINKNQDEKAVNIPDPAGLK